MSLIDVQHLTFAYEGNYDNIFEDVSFQIDTNWKLGFVGRNGRGKTTFLNLLIEKYSYQGTISSSVAFEYFPYDVKNRKKETIAVIEEIAPDSLVWQIERELSLLAVKNEVLYRSFATLSNGEKTKVLLAALFLKENSFLLIDEPTNHLDIDAREIVGNYLHSKKGFILVSHDRELLDTCVDHILSINKTNIEVQKGNYSSWLANKEAQDQHELAENDRLKKDVKKLEKAAKQAANWSDKVEKTKKGQRVAGLRPDRGHIGHQAAKMMKRSKVIDTRRQKAVKEKSELLQNMEDADTLFLKPLPFPKQVLAELKDVAVCYEGNAALMPVSFTLKKGDRLLLTGKNGSGKSSILKMFLGKGIPHTGVFSLSQGLIVSYVSQDTSFLKGSLKQLADNAKIEEPLFKAILRKLDFSRQQFEKPIESYSEGQKKKVLIAKSLCEQAHLYVWDEPLNFIDILSRSQIEELILRSNPTMLFVEHDKVFQTRIATKKVELKKSESG